ncbi:hypothetical protein [Paenibacillus cremeus]|uniref:Uncharacterized protein n=1 Tax=Paenibacillus cremeus TaxID=2163881 RepID=A0A559JAE8_9BACL|nr:hypothetical protein [Paenibacillus cremeus]TVX96821.1 hypothetical protein FPZ49_35285 [Paenibacillus cremeus]
MTEQKSKGHVEFRQPAVKLVADIPGDAEMRENIDDMQISDGYPGSCGIVGGYKRNTAKKSD